MTSARITRTTKNARYYGTYDAVIPAEMTSGVPEGFKLAITLRNVGFYNDETDTMSSEWCDFMVLLDPQGNEVAYGARLSDDDIYRTKRDLLAQIGLITSIRVDSHSMGYDITWTI